MGSDDDNDNEVEDLRKKVLELEVERDAARVEREAVRVENERIEKEREREREKAKREREKAEREERERAERERGQREREEGKKLIRTDADIYQAVNEWCSNRKAAEEKYGHISDWDVSRVTSMR